MRPIDADVVQQMIDVAEERFEKEPAKAGHGRKYFNCKCLKYFIGKFPTLDVAPVIYAYWEHGAGDWDNILGEYYLRPTYICSNCHEEERINSAYCPNCGAKMDLEEPNENC